MDRRWFALAALFLEACGCGGGGGGGEQAVVADATAPAWDRIGFDGKTIRSLTYDPQTSTLYAGVENEGLYKTIDGGATWSWAGGSDGALQSADVRSVAVDPLAPTVLYAATDKGLFRSTDGAGSWSWIDLSKSVQTQMVVMTLTIGPTPPPPSQSLNVVIVDPVLPDIVYAGGVSGIFSSTDGGKSWMNEPKVGLLRDLAIGTIGSYRFVYAATDSGIHRLIINSPTATEHVWTQVNEEAAIGVAVDPSNAWTLYVAFADRFARSFEGGAGALWTTILLGEARDIAVPAAGIVYAATASGLFQSNDMGGTWVDLSFAGPSPTCVAVASPTLVYVGTDGGGVLERLLP